jgi:DNA-3-methyladenine glycosylase II
MGERIARVGHIRRMVDPDPFRALSLQVVGQQISNAALATVWSRVVARTAGLGGFSTDSVLALGQDGLASCGMSGRKASYVMGIATAVESGSCDLADLRDLPDADVISRLTTLRGVGTWTAEMFLIFSLGRLDVLAMDDLGIRNGMRRLYHHREVTPAIFERHRRRYSPYGTVASLYLWEAAQG